MSEYLYIEFAKGTLVLHLIFSGIFIKFFQKLNFIGKIKIKDKKFWEDVLM